MPPAAGTASFGYRPYMQAELQQPVLLRFAPGGHQLAIGFGGGRDRDGAVEIWDVQAKRSVRTIVAHPKGVSALAFDPAGRILASAGQKGHVLLHDLEGNAPPRDLKAHKGIVRALAFSPDGATMASAGKDKLVKLWDVASGTLLGELKGHQKDVVAVQFTPDGGQLVTCSRDKTLRSWDPVSRRELRTITESAARYGELNHSVGSPDGFLVAMAIKEVKAAIQGRRRARGGIREIDFVGIRDFKTGELVGRLEGHLETINALSYSPDGRYLASASNDHSVMVWDVIAGTRVATIELPESVLAVDFSSDGRFLAACDENGGLFVYRLTGVSSLPAVVSSGRIYQPPALPLAAWDGPPLRIAVMDLEAKSVPADVAAILSGSLRNVLLRTGRFDLVDRQHLEAVLGELGLQLSGVVDEATAVKVGQQAGAEFLLFGAVGRLGDTYSLHLELTNVETGKIQASAEELCSCGEEDLFLAVGTAAGKLLVK